MLVASPCVVNAIPIRDAGEEWPRISTKRVEVESVHDQAHGLPYFSDVEHNVRCLTNNITCVNKTIGSHVTTDPTEPFSIQRTTS